MDIRDPEGCPAAPILASWLLPWESCGPLRRLVMTEIYMKLDDVV